MFSYSVMAIHWASGTGSLENYFVFIVEKVVQGWVLVVLMTLNIESCVRCILKTKTKTQEVHCVFLNFYTYRFFFHSFSSHNYTKYSNEIYHFNEGRILS
jgi:hypothetical protein